MLVGGATGVGKSTVAEGLARRLRIVRVLTTDVVREVLRDATPDGRSGVLAVSTFETAVGEAVVDGFLDQARLVAQGVASALRRALVEQVGMIVEGVHLVPGCFPRVPAAVVVPLVIAVDDVDAHRALLVERSRGSSRRPPERYLENFPRIRRIHDEVVRRAEDHGVPVVHATTPEATTDDALAIVEGAAAVQAATD